MVDHSPGGERALFVARGAVFTVPVEKGPVRNLTGRTTLPQLAAVLQLADVKEQRGDERLEKRVERLSSHLEQFVGGSLTDDQRRMVAAHVSAQPELLDERLADRKYRQEIILGIVKNRDQKNAKTWTVQTANEIITIPREDIEDFKEQDKSMMPDDVIKALTDD